MAKEDAKRYDPWLPRRFETNACLPNLPAAIYASHIAPRISTQRSCFTVHGSQTNGLDQLAEEQDSKMVKVVIPGSCVQKIKRELMTCGIDEVTIYPDLDGLGRLLMAVLKVEASQIWPAGAKTKNESII
jgi:hypothetical protein